jgi:hypothetical protein
MASEVLIYVTTLRYISGGRNLERDPQNIWPLRNKNLTENTLPLRYADQRNSRCFLWEPCETHKYTLWPECRVSVLWTWSLKAGIVESEEKYIARQQGMFRDMCRSCALNDLLCMLFIAVKLYDVTVQNCDAVLFCFHGVVSQTSQPYSHVTMRAMVHISDRFS